MCRQSHKIPRLIRETACFPRHPSDSYPQMHLFHYQCLCIKSIFTDTRQSTASYVKGMKHPWKIVNLIPLPLVRFLLLRVLLITSNKIHIDIQVLSKCDSVQLIFRMIKNIQLRCYCCYVYNRI